jgi:hypothetical protein
MLIILASNKSCHSRKSQLTPAMSPSYLMLRVARMSAYAVRGRYLTYKGLTRHGLTSCNNHWINDN